MKNHFFMLKSKLFHGMPKYPTGAGTRPHS